MGIKKFFKSLFNIQSDSYYVEELDVLELNILFANKSIPNVEEILYIYLDDNEEITIPNTEEGFIFYDKEFKYVIEIDDYITDDINLFPNMTISKGNDSLIIKLFMKKD